MELSPHSISILVVEDETVIREVMGVMISRKFPGTALLFAENGTRGVELFKEHAPDIVITDIQLPEMDGIEMAGIIKTIKNDTKFIVLTAFSNKEYFDKFNVIGIHDFLAKPIEFEKLFAAIEKCRTMILFQNSGEPHVQN